MPLYELKANMPASEYMGWITYLNSKSDAQSGKVNLANASPDDFIKGVMGG